MSTNNIKLLAWVNSMAALCKPKDIVWCDGSQQEWETMWDIMVKGGTAKKLDEKQTTQQLLHPFSSRGCRTGRRPHLYLLSESKKQDAGPTNNWCDPADHAQNPE